MGSQDELVKEIKSEGVVILKDVLSTKLKSSLKKAWEDSYKMNPADSSRFYNKIAPVFNELHTNKEILNFVKPILGNDIAVYFYRLMAKTQNWFGEVPPHQEAPYFHGGQKKLMCFVPLGPMNKKNGGLYFIPGSHLYGFLGRVNDHEIDLSVFPSLKKCYVDADLGDIIIHDYLLWHGSDVAEEPSTRPVFHILYQPATDGSSYGEIPTLSAGKWRTSNFLPFKYGVIERENNHKPNTQDKPIETELNKINEFVLDQAAISPEEGFCHIIQLKEIPGKLNCSEYTFKILEGDQPLNHYTDDHSEIRKFGGGRYSCWGEFIYFSSLNSTGRLDPSFPITLQVFEKYA
jgi:hypothetical protein